MGVGRAVGATVGAALLLGALPAAAAPTSSLRMWRVSLIRPGRALPLTLDVDVTTTGPRWLALAARINVSRGQRTGAPLSMTQAGERPIVYDNGTAVEPCGACTLGGGEADLSLTLPAITDEVLLVVREGSAVARLRSPGWRVREIAPTGFRTVNAYEASATGASAGVSVERFTGAAAPGGRYGSMTWLSLSCNAAGVGTLKLTPTPRRGGDKPGEASCTDRHEGTVATTPGSAQWQVTGDAVGVGLGSTELLVLDYPRA